MKVRKRSLFLICALSACGTLNALQTPSAGSCYVYPAPANGTQVTVVYNMPYDGTALITVYNEAGDFVAQNQQVDGVGLQQTSLDISHYRSGLYICRVELQFASGGSQALALFKFAVSH